MMILLKIVVTSTMVLGLSYLNERAGPRVAGIFAGFPIGIAISLFFIGIEQGAPFAAATATSGLAGLGAALVFCFAYWQASMRATRWSIPAASLASFAAFFAAGGLLSMLPQDRWLLAAVTISLAAAFALVFRRIPDGPSLRKVEVSARTLLIRAASASVIVLVITQLAGIVGPTWAGLLAGFPLTLFPVLVIAQLTFGSTAPHGIIKAFPYGVGGLIVCALVASFVLEPLGVYKGMAAAMAVAGLYLGLVATFMLRPKRVPALPAATLRPGPGAG